MIKWFEKNKIISLIITFLIAIEIFYFSSIPGVAISAEGNIWFSRIYHFTVFFLFSFFFFATIKGIKEIKIRYILIALIISVTYSILDEVHQLFVPFRAFSIKDILTNTAGIFFSIIIYSHINKKLKKKA